MPVYLKVISNKKKKFTFPSNPDGEVELKFETSYQDYNFIRKGRRSYPSGMEKQPISWSGYFWGKRRKQPALVAKKAKWISPKKCVKKLKKWQARGTPLNLIISESGINEDVTISSFEYKPFGGNGDISYEIEFLPYYPIKIFSVQELKKKKKKKTSRTSKRTASAGSGETASTRTYKIKSGDTLCKISRKYYGKESKWETIYKANKKALKKAAKKHGRKNSDHGKYLYAGTVLTIP